MSADHAQDRSNIIAVINGESAAFFARDYELWASFWLHSPAARHWNWSHEMGMILHVGWERISAAGRVSMAAFPTPTQVTGRREWLEFTIGADMALVLFDQHSDTQTDPMEIPGLHHEMWVLQKVAGRWLVVSVSTLQPRTQTATVPVVQVDDRGRVQWANPQALARLKDHAGLTVSGGRLRAKSRSVDRSLQSAFAWAAARIGGAERQAAVRQNLGTGAAVPILSQDSLERGAALLCWVMPIDGMVLVTFDDEATLDHRISAASMVFRLSPAQTRLARRLVEGQDLAQAAAAMGVSVNTARTQLQRIFDKVGVHNQVALVRVLLSIAPPLQ